MNELQRELSTKHWFRTGMSSNEELTQRSGTLKSNKYVFAIDIKVIVST